MRIFVFCGIILAFVFVAGTWVGYWLRTKKPKFIPRHDRTGYERRDESLRVYYGRLMSMALEYPSIEVADPELLRRLEWIFRTSAVLSGREEPGSE